MEERFVNLTSEVNGRAQILDYLLKNVNAYLEQLEAEVDGNPAAEKYLEQCQTELGKASTVVGDVAKIRHMDALTDQRHDLRKLLPSLKDRFENISEMKIALNFDDSVDSIIKGSEDQLLEIFMFLLNCVAESGQLAVKLEKIELDSTCVSLSRSSLAHGVYWALSFSTNPLVDIQEFVPVLNTKNNAFKNKLFHRDGNLIYGSLLRLFGDLFSYEDSNGTFALTALLPALDNSAVQGALDNSLGDQAYHGDETILVVDDEDMIWDILIENLQELGYTVILAENGADAVQIYRENPGMFAVVILDMVMPIMNGREAFGELKKLDDDVKVLLSSGYMAEGEAGDLLDQGAKGFLRKPYKMIDLAKKIRAIIN